MAGRADVADMVQETEERRVWFEHMTAECAASLRVYLRHSANLPGKTLPVDTAGVRDALRRYVSALRAMEYPPEAVIKTTKALLLRAAGNSDELRPFAEAAVAWAIEAYYDG